MIESMKAIVSLYGNYIQMGIAVLLFIGFLCIMISVSKINDAREQMNKIMRWLYDSGRGKVIEAEEKRKERGRTTTGDEESLAIRFITNIDDKLVYSGISERYTWLNPTTYIAGSLIIASLLFLLGLLLGGFVIGFIFLLAGLFGPYIYISRLAYSNYLATEKQLEFFINLVSSNASLSADLLTILKDIAHRTAEPVRGAIYNAASTAEASSRADEGVARLIRDIEYPLFKEFIRNLDICGKQDADYRNVAKDFSKQAEVSLRAIERQRAIFSNARNEVLLMIGMGVLLSWMTANFSEMSLLEIIKDMRNSMLGIVCLVAEVIIYASSILYILVGKRK